MIGLLSINHTKKSLRNPSELPPKNIIFPFKKKKKAELSRFIYQVIARHKCKRARWQAIQLPFPLLSLSLSLFVFTFISADPAVSDFHSVLTNTVCEVGQVSAIFGKFHWSPGFYLPWFSVPLIPGPLFLKL